MLGGTTNGVAVGVADCVWRGELFGALVLIEVDSVETNEGFVEGINEVVAVLVGIFEGAIVFAIDGVAVCVIGQFILL